MRRSPAPVTINSPANPRIRAAAALRQRRDRERTGLTLIDGIRELDRALTAGVRVVEVFVTPDLAESSQGAGLLDRLSAAGVASQPVTEAALARIAYGNRSEGVVAVVATPPASLADIALPPDPLVVVVEHVEKPGNLGAILRSADGAGADALIAADSGTDLYNPNAIRASLGSIFAVPLAASPTPDVIGWLAARGLRPVMAKVDAETLYTDADLTGPIAIVLGSEADGLSRAWDDVEGTSVRLPMLGVSDSLNVSVASAILLYEARRQRDRSPGR
jgi:RNA methyltransferase, TrmH family